MRSGRSHASRVLQLLLLSTGIGASGAACTASTGTKITPADAREFVEKVATRQQVRAKFGEPGVTSTSESGPCDSYSGMSKNAVTGAYDYAQAMFCYDNNDVLASKQITGQQGK